MTENCSCTRSKLSPSTCILFAVLRLEHLLRRGHDALRSTAGGSRTDVEEHNDISLESGDIGAGALVCHDGRRRGILNLASWFGTFIHASNIIYRTGGAHAQLILNTPRTPSVIVERSLREGLSAS